MYVSRGRRREPKSTTRGEVMVEQVRVLELTTEGQKQDCGCGCGGGSCGTAQQELVLASAAQVAEMRQKAASNGGGCDGSCGCQSE